MMNFYFKWDTTQITKDTHTKSNGGLQKCVTSLACSLLDADEVRKGNRVGRLSQFL